MPNSPTYPMREDRFFPNGPPSAFRFSLIVVGAWPPGGNAEAYFPGPHFASLLGSASPFNDIGFQSPSLLYATATRLQNGEVLVTGGMSGEPVAESWTTGGGGFVRCMPMGEPRSNHTATLLKNGTVLVCGGFTWRWARRPKGPPIKELDVSHYAQIYDPATRSFGALIRMNSRRANHTATALRDGRVVIVGGVDGASSHVPSIDVFDPVTGVFSVAPTDVAIRTQLHTATLIGNEVVVIGGYQTDGQATQTLFDIDLDRQGDIVHPTPLFLQHARGEHTATPINGGQQILIVGGASNSFGGQLIVETELVSVSGFVWPGVQPIRHGRVGHAAALLPDGSVLVVGGADANHDAMSIAEVWRPAPTYPGPLVSADVGPTNYLHGAGVRIA